jgi:mannose-6-phosphate isomerase-like protein (cupin superfamily)
MAKAFVRGTKDVEPTCPPKHENTSTWSIITPKVSGSNDIEFLVTEIRPGGAAFTHVHEDADHVYFFTAGRAYAIVNGERFEVSPGDALFIPRNAAHEIHPIGEETLRMVVTLSPARQMVQV